MNPPWQGALAGRAVATMYSYERRVRRARPADDGQFKVRVRGQKARAAPREPPGAPAASRAVAPSRAAGWGGHQTGHMNKLCF